MIVHFDVRATAANSQKVVVTKGHTRLKKTCGAAEATNLCTFGPSDALKKSLYFSSYLGVCVLCYFAAQYLTYIALFVQIHSNAAQSSDAKIVISAPRASVQTNLKTHASKYKTRKSLRTIPFFMCPARCTAFVTPVGIIPTCRPWSEDQSIGKMSGGESKEKEKTAIREKRHAGYLHAHTYTYTHTRIYTLHACHTYIFTHTFTYPIHRAPNTSSCVCRVRDSTNSKYLSAAMYCRNPYSGIHSVGILRYISAGDPGLVTWAIEDIMARTIFIRYSARSLLVGMLCAVPVFRPFIFHHCFFFQFLRSFLIERQKSLMRGNLNKPHTHTTHARTNERAITQKLA